MNRARTADTIWLVVLGLFVAAIAVAILSGCGTHHKAAAPVPTVPTVVVGHNTTTVCSTVAVTDKLANREHKTYVGLLTTKVRNDRVGYGSALAFAYSPKANYGPLGPAIAYLAARLHNPKLAPPSPVVVASAWALDANRIRHACDHLLAP